VRREAGQPLQIVLPRQGRLRHAEDQIRPGDRGDDRAPDAGRAVHHQQIQISLLRDRARVLPDQRHQLPGVFPAGVQARVDHRTVARLGDIPLPAAPQDELHRLGWAHVPTHATPFAGEGHHSIRLRNSPVAGTVKRDGTEPTMFGACAAARAPIRDDAGPSPSLELFDPQGFRREDQVQIGGVHIAIGQHLSLRQRGERGDHARLARPALAAEDDQLLHERTAPRSRPKRSVIQRSNPGKWRQASSPRE
jgi:hypothetical protein